MKIIVEEKRAPIYAPYIQAFIISSTSTSIININPSGLASPPLIRALPFSVPACCAYVMVMLARATLAFMQHIAATKNHVTGLRVDDRVVVDQENMAEVVDTFFEDLLGLVEDCEFSLTLDFRRLPTFDLSHHEGGFIEEDVWQTIKDMELNKSPGPNGSTGSFFRTCWSIIKVGHMAIFNTVACKYFRDFCLFNQALIFLLPKKSDVIEVRDYCLPSLIHSLPKLVVRRWPLAWLWSFPGWWDRIRAPLLKADAYMTTTCWFKA